MHKGCAAIGIIAINRPVVVFLNEKVALAQIDRVITFVIWILTVNVGNEIVNKYGALVDILCIGIVIFISDIIIKDDIIIIVFEIGLHFHYTRVDFPVDCKILIHIEDIGTS